MVAGLAVTVQGVGIVGAAGASDKLVQRIGLGLSSAPATTSILQGAPAHAQGSAAGVNNAAREVGALGIAAMGSALNSTYAELHGRPSTRE